MVRFARAGFAHQTERLALLQNETDAINSAEVSRFTIEQAAVNGKKLPQIRDLPASNSCVLRVEET